MTGETSRRNRVSSPLGGPAATAGVVASTDERPRLRLRELTGWEEEYIEQQAGETNTARLCNEVLARCLVAPNEPLDEARASVRTLLVSERDRELVELRRISLGSTVQAQVTCPDCGEVSEVDFSLDALPLAFEPPPKEVAVDLPDFGRAVLRLPTAGDQEDVLDAHVEGEAERRSWLLGRCLVRYGDRVEGFDVDFARTLPVGVRTRLESAIEEALPDLSLEMSAECSHCGASFSAPFDVASFFFSS